MTVKKAVKKTVKKEVKNNPAKKTLTRVEGKKSLITKKKSSPKSNGSKPKAIELLEKQPKIVINTVQEKKPEVNVEVSKAEVSKAEVSKVEVSKAEVSKAEVSKDVKKVKPCPLSEKAEALPKTPGFTLHDLQDAVRRTLPTLHNEDLATTSPYVVCAAITCFLNKDVTSASSLVLQYALRLRREYGSYEKIMKNN